MSALYISSNICKDLLKITQSKAKLPIQDIWQSNRLNKRKVNMLKQVNPVVREIKQNRIPTRYDDITKELRLAREMSKNSDYFHHIEKQSEYTQANGNTTYTLGNLFENVLKKINV